MSALLVRAITILTRRDHSEYELRRKLLAQPASMLEIDDVIAYCYQHAWLDDFRYAQNYLTHRCQKGYGSQRILMEMIQRGVNKELAIQVIKQSGVDWVRIARVTIQKKMGAQVNNEMDRMLKIKLQRFLHYRGFHSSEIQEVFENLIE